MDFALAEVHEAIAAAVPDRECIVRGGRPVSYREVTDRSRRLANHLIAGGLGVRRERGSLAGWESGQDHLALYLYNGNEYLEGMLGAFKARVAPFNVNYRYVEEELVYLLRDAGARGVVYHARFAPTLEKILPQLPELKVLLQVADDSGNGLVDGAVDYEQALAEASASRPDVAWSPDDLYILYTGGTTGMPKGVLWRQADIFVSALGGQTASQSGEEFASLAGIVERAAGGAAAVRVLPAPPFMHGAAHWSAFHAFHTGGTIVIQDETERLDPHDIWSTVERDGVQVLLIVGDAFGRPLLDGLRAGSYGLDSLGLIVTGGAALNASLKAELIAELPHVAILDAVGSSETGTQAQHMSSKDAGAATGRFQAGPQNMIISEDMKRVLPRGSDELGWLARSGRVPLGYLGDPDKTRRTFPVVEGVRCSVPGDRARMDADGVIELLGRDSVTINSGGEKIFAEEVEQALKHHRGVYDAVVVGRPSERWGQEVVAIVRLRDGEQVDEAALLEECAKHVARYKLPKAFLFRDEIVRSPSGKADYRWAKLQVSG